VEERAGGLGVATEDRLVTPGQRGTLAEDEGAPHLVVAAPHEDLGLGEERERAAVVHRHVEVVAGRPARRTWQHHRRRHAGDRERCARTDADAQHEVVAAERAGPAADEVHDLTRPADRQRRVGAEARDDVAAVAPLHLDHRLGPHA
jgi:hypothetical protein